ncbi:MAG: thioredoxin domain-containing protein [Caulobacterales bacterium]
MLFAAIVLATSLGACKPATQVGPAAHPGKESAEDKAFGARVKAYLLAHPEVLREAIDKLQAQEDAQQEQAMAAADVKAKAALPALRAALEHDGRDFVANPDGRITVTEFYDYRCPHCVNAAPKVLALIRGDRSVRFVFKEMPIFGDTSEHAARVAIAAKAQGKDYVGLYQAMMATHPLTDDAIDALAAQKGVNLAQTRDPKFVAAADVQIADVAELARKLAVDGTPAFIVGDDIVHGEDMAAVSAAIARARTKA